MSGGATGDEGGDPACWAAEVELPAGVERRLALPEIGEVLASADQATVEVPGTSPTAVAFAADGATVELVVPAALAVVGSRLAASVVDAAGRTVRLEGPVSTVRSTPSGATARVVLAVEAVEGLLRSER